MRSRLLKLGLPVLLILIGMLLLTVLRSLEWDIWFGDRTTRLASCRSIYLKKSRWRARMGLQRLLRDPEPAVRFAAIEALERRPDLHDLLSSRIRKLAESPAAAEQARALEFLLRQQREDVASLALARDCLSAADAGVERRSLYHAYIENRAAAADPTLLPWVIGKCRQPETEAQALQPLLRFSQLLSPYRESFIDLLARAPAGARNFALAALTAIDGRRRGDHPDDWRLSAGLEVTPAKSLERLLIEAEWADDIQLNYQIAQLDGETCLLLDEGAGGHISWLGGDASSVDIGVARYRFYLARNGNYELWMRCWLADKCGNSQLVQIDGARLSNFSDAEDLLRVWHWQRLGELTLAAGAHDLLAQALEDGTSVDKYALVPTRTGFDPNSPGPLTPVFDGRQQTALSFSVDAQQQTPGTRQTLTVWVRRQRLDLTAARLRLLLPPPFRAVHGSETEIAFASASPLARSSFIVELPSDARGGEYLVSAELSTAAGLEATAAFPLGVHHDWWTTGPLKPDDPLCRELLARRQLSREELTERWSRYPTAGYDRYRRLDFEGAWGPLQDVYVFLYAELEAGAGGDYRSLLTLDDYGEVNIDGAYVSGRRSGGPAEGKMLNESCRLGPGLHRVFAWVYQADFPDPSGAVAGRMTPNYFVFKWLLRRSRHELAGDLHGVRLD